MDFADHLAGQDPQDGATAGALVCAEMGDRVLAQSAQERLRGGAPADEKRPSAGASPGAGYDRRLARAVNDPLGQRTPRIAGRVGLHPGGVGGRGKSQSKVQNRLSKTGIVLSKVQN